MTLHVVLVRPQFPGNVGFAARAMLNFGVERLWLVEPCAITNETRDRAVHAQRVLDDARVVGSLREVVEEVDWLLAFAARVSANDRSHVRTPIPFAEAAEAVADLDAGGSDVALVFGPEDDGLGNEDVLLCDAVASLPTSELYRSMNLSHAVAVALYGVSQARPAPERRTTGKPATARDKELLFANVETVLRALRYPDHRVRVTGQAFRRVVGRAVLTRWEYHRIMGMFTRTAKFLEKTPPPWAEEVAEETQDTEPEDPEGQG